MLSTIIHFLDLTYRTNKMEKNTPQETEIDALLIQYLTGSASKEEQELVKLWLNESYDHKKYFDQLRELYFLGKIATELSNIDKSKNIERIKRKYYQARLDESSLTNKFRSFYIRYKTALSIAATFIVALGIGYFLRTAVGFKPANDNSPLVYNEIVSPKGARTHIVLPDGTKVWLNANSRIKYAMDFLKGDRKVLLTGEAYFDVVKDPQKRFIVQTSDLAIRVWGTKFNVKAYPEEKTIQTTLVEGSVSILPLNKHSQEKETYLNPNQSAIFYKSQQVEEIITSKEEKAESKATEEIAKKEVETVDTMLVEKDVNTILYTSWKDKKWIIESQTLEQFAVELERRYNVIISFNDDVIKSYRFNGILTDETFEQVLNAIKLSAPIDYEVHGNKVLLKENAKSRSNYNKFLKRRTIY